MECILDDQRNGANKTVACLTGLFTVLPQSRHSQHNISINSNKRRLPHYHPNHQTYSSRESSSESTDYINYKLCLKLKSSDSN